MKKLANENWILPPYLLIAGAVVARLSMSLPYNFVPIFSCLLFFAATRPRREYPIPLIALMGVDIFLTEIWYGYPLTGDHAVTWLWYLAAMMLSARMLRGSVSVPRGLVASLLTSASFFLASNFAVWAAWRMYPKTWSGLANCYIAAAPFFRNSVVAETISSVVVFGVAQYSQVWTTTRRMQHACS